MIEDQRNLSLHAPAGIVVIGEGRRGDAEPGEDHRPLDARAGTDDADSVLTRLGRVDPIRVSDLQSVVVPDEATSRLKL